MSEKFDVVIIGGGHNGLVAACYLALARKKVLILEANSEMGGAATSVQTFAGIPAQISRYSYLVSLLPDQIVKDLSIDFETRSRGVSSYTPYSKAEVHGGLLVTRQLDSVSRASFFESTGAQSEFKAWEKFYGELSRLAPVIAQTLLQPLPTRSQVKERVQRAGMAELWRDVIEVPLGETLRERFSDDLVRGIVLTDGLIGTLTPADSFLANICFLYHVIGNGSGEWKVPLGGMGSLTKKLIARASELGVEMRVDSEVTKVLASENRLAVEISEHSRVECDYIAANCAPQILSILMGQEPPTKSPGSQLKINMLLKKLPRLKSGIDPKVAFSGTFHINESYSQLESAFRQASEGNIPDVIPAEMYCHSLTDPSILSPELIERGYQTLTLFAIHLPYSLFLANNEETKELLKVKIFQQLNQYLLDPIETCLAEDGSGMACVEVKSPIDLEVSLSMPLGNIFHQELEFPFQEEGSTSRWGVETEHERIVICGAGAKRGGGVSGIGGHNAAMAIIELDRERNE